ARHRKGARPRGARGTRLFDIRHRDDGGTVRRRFRHGAGRRSRHAVLGRSRNIGGLRAPARSADPRGRYERLSADRPWSLERRAGAVPGRGRATRHAGRPRNLGDYDGWIHRHSCRSCRNRVRRQSGRAACRVLAPGRAGRRRRSKRALCRQLRVPRLGRLSGQRPSHGATCQRARAGAKGGRGRRHGERRSNHHKRAPLTLIRPFRALRPAPGRAADVLAPPYDVLSSAEARDRAKGKPWSFLRVSKAEIDLDPAIDLYDRAVYAKAAENLRRMIAAGVLARDDKPCYYAYRLTWRDRIETGFAAEASIAAYAENRIRKHELTTLAKEDDRVRQIEAVDAQTGPVMLAYPEAPGIDALLARAAAERPAVDVTADDGVRHQLWVIDDEAMIAALTSAVDALPALYIADGHHRSAAALRVAQARGEKDGYFLAVLLPQQQMT